MAATLQRFSIADLNRVYCAKACDSIVAASEEGTIEIQALARDYYHGKPIPDDEIAAVKYLGFWGARLDQNWGLPWQRHKFGNPNIAASKLHWLVIDVEGRQPHQPWQWPPLGRTEQARSGWPIGRSSIRFGRSQID